MKYSVWLVWIGGAAAILFGNESVGRIGQLVVGLTLLAHVVEFFVNRGLFERVGGSMRHHLVQTLIYGLFYWMPLKQQDASAQSGA